MALSISVVDAGTWAPSMSLTGSSSTFPKLISHRPRCACDQCNIQAIKGCRLIPASINVETKGDFASSCCWLRGHGCIWGNETRTHYVTVAVLKIVSSELPGHIDLPPMSLLMLYKSCVCDVIIVIGSVSYNVVNMPSAQVCVTLPLLCVMVVRTTQRFVREAHLL